MEQKQTIKKKITILGSTGSVGRNALEVVRFFPNQFEVFALSTFSNIELLEQQIIEFQPKIVGIHNPESARKIKEKFPNLQVYEGSEGIAQVARFHVDILLCAIVGSNGLKPILEGINAGNTIAIANKEPLVMAGKLITQKAKEKNVPLIPVDSEHSAIFQCLLGQDKNALETVYLTASGGPFYSKSAEELHQVTPEEAIQHPTWKMGKKISVDSATLMNKGLEIIEAMWLFDLNESQIEVVIHPQSIIHGLIEFTDGNIIAHLGPTDMKLPILFSLTYPKRSNQPIKRIKLTDLAKLTFDFPDVKKFPCLLLARQSAKQGGMYPTILNSANEVAVQAFCDNKIKFTQIYQVVAETLSKVTYSTNECNLDMILEVDMIARQKALEIVEQLS